MKSPLLIIPRSRSTSRIEADLCRGEDSNLCRIAEHYLSVSRPEHPQERLYMVREAPDGPVKLGVSDDPHGRTRILQVGNPRELVLVAWVDVERGTEKNLHALFSSDLISGEWFAPSPMLEHLLVHAAARMELAA